MIIRIRKISRQSMLISQKMMRFFWSDNWYQILHLHSSRRQTRGRKLKGHEQGTTTSSSFPFLLCKIKSSTGYRFEVREKKVNGDDDYNEQASESHPSVRVVVRHFCLTGRIDRYHLRPPWVNGLLRIET